MIAKARSPWWRWYGDRVFGFDYRSLALFRILVGALVLQDGIARLLDVRAHYTDQGVLPLAIIDPLLEALGRWSIHAWSGHLGYEVFLFLLEIAAAVCLIVGFRSKVAVVVCWILAVSAENRFPLSTYPVEFLTRSYLMWALLLPIDEVWSVRAAKRRTKTSEVTRETYLSFATVGLTLHIVLFMFTSGISKTGVSWDQGTASYYMVNSLRYGQRNNDIVMFFSDIIVATTPYLPWFEVLVLAWFIPFKRNIVVPAVILLCLVLIGLIRFSMYVGVLIEATALGYAVLLPSSFWRLKWVDRISARIGTTLSPLTGGAS